MKDARIFLALAAGMIRRQQYGLYQLGAEHGAKTADINGGRHRSSHRQESAVLA